MNMLKWAIALMIAVMLVALAFFLINDYMGPGHSGTEGGPTAEEAVSGNADSPRQVLQPEIYLNGMAGSERIESGSTRVLSGNISLTFRFPEPVDIEIEGGFTITGSDGREMDRYSIGYGGVERTTVLLDIPPGDAEREPIKIIVGRDVFMDENARMREPVALYINRYRPNKAEILQVAQSGELMEPEAWVTEGTKVFNLAFDRPVNTASVEKAVVKNATLETGDECPQIEFDWLSDSEVEIAFLDLAEGSYFINLTGAEDIIGLRMEGWCGVGNCWRFNVSSSQRIKTYNLETGEFETLEGEAFKEATYLSGRIDGGDIVLHKFRSADIDIDGVLSFDKMVYDEIDGTAEKTAFGGDLKEYYGPLLKKGWKFRGVKLSPGGDTVAAFASKNQTGSEGRVVELMLIDAGTGMVQRTMEMPFYIYAAGDGTFPLDLHFDWISDSIIFTEGYTMLGNTANIYGINIETGVVVPLKKNAREPRFVDGLKLLSAIKMEKSGEGTMRVDGQNEQTISYYSDSAVILLGIYGNQLREYNPIEGYEPYERARECAAYDSIGSIIWSHENKLVYPGGMEGNSRLIIQDLGNGKTETVDAGMEFIFLGIRDGKAYMLEDTNSN